MKNQAIVRNIYLIFQKAVDWLSKLSVPYFIHTAKASNFCSFYILGELEKFIQKSISQSSGGWGVQDQGAQRSSIWKGLVSGLCIFLLCPSTVEAVLWGHFYEISHLTLRDLSTKEEENLDIWGIEDVQPDKHKQWAGTGESSRSWVAPQSIYRYDGSVQWIAT